MVLVIDSLIILANFFYICFYLAVDSNLSESCDAFAVEMKNRTFLVQVQLFGAYNYWPRIDKE